MLHLASPPPHPLLLGLLLAVAAGAATRAVAAPDVELKLGLVRGTIAVPKSESLPVARQFTFGGASSAVAMTSDLAQHHMVYGQWILTMDTTNRQIVQQGFDVGYGYHLLGGRRHERTGSDNFYVDERNSSNITALVQAGQHQYTTGGSAAGADTDKITGGVLDIGFGLEWRRDLSDTHALGVQALTTLMAFSMSTSRLTATTQAGLLFWRFTF